MPETHLESLFYKGQSMYPTFRFSDILQIAPYQGERIRCGDVVIFIYPKNGEKVVHRVVSLGAEGIKTAGDNCNKTDGWFLRSCDILGRVVYIKRENRIRKVYGGRRGLAYLTFLKAKRIVKRGIFRLLRPPYRWLSRIGIFNRILPYRRKMRFLIFNRPVGKELQILIKNQMIAKKILGGDKIYVRRPFRMLINDLLTDGTKLNINR